MARILIVFATRYSHTRKIADHLGAKLRLAGHTVGIVDSAREPASMGMLTYDAFILAASVNYGRHRRSMVSFAKRHLFELRSSPSAFLSVSATAASSEETSRQEGERLIDAFITETGLRPTASLPVAGAIAYTRYRWPLRLVMRLIMRRSGGALRNDVDTSRDYEYTDWAHLDQFVDDFLARHLACGQEALL